jgi:hypothetical protein
MHLGVTGVRDCLIFLQLIGYHLSGWVEHLTEDGHLILQNSNQEYQELDSILTAYSIIIWGHL